MLPLAVVGRSAAPVAAADLMWYPEAALNADGRMGIFAMDTASRTTYHKWQVEPNGGWSPMVPV
ncbi:hypothetical protein [Nonomuraea salmonea]|uniref:Uncharacterized protein n=1 Tax=Nonomuraea salmonea TaxID=46181 RepID=A0ABV5P1A1_9ACTN